MAPTFERFKNLGAGVQSWLIGLAVVVGGLWTLYTFGALGTVQRAKLELFQQAQINIKIDAEQLRGCTDGYCIAARVTISNAGRNAHLDYARFDPFSVTKIEFNSDGTSRFGPTLTQPSLLSGSRTLRTGESVDYPFFVRVPEPGLYLLQFAVPLDSAEMAIHNLTGPDAPVIFWLGTGYVDIVGS